LTHGNISLPSKASKRTQLTSQWEKRLLSWGCRGRGQNHTTVFHLKQRLMRGAHLQFTIRLKDLAL